jgi:hypothetical protein
VRRSTHAVEIRDRWLSHSRTPFSRRHRKGETKTVPPKRRERHYGVIAAAALYSLSRVNFWAHCDCSNITPFLNRAFHDEFRRPQRHSCSLAGFYWLIRNFINRGRAGPWQPPARFDAPRDEYERLRITWLAGLYAPMRVCYPSAAAALNNRESGQRFVGLGPAHRQLFPVDQPVIKALSTASALHVLCKP